MPQDSDWNWMRRAVDLAKKSEAEDDKACAPRVGAVFVKNGRIVAEGYRGMGGKGCHAEYSALMSANENEIEGSTVYTTLEPCTKRGYPKTPCASRLVDAKVAEVVIGLFDPNPHIFRKGWKILKAAGIVLRDFAPELRAELREANEAFLDQFRTVEGESSNARFDYIQTRFFNLVHGVSIRTEWSRAGKGVIHAYSTPGYIALAHGAKEFREIDDPGALDFDENKRAVTARVGQIVVFGTPTGHYALVKILEVLSEDRGDTHSELSFEYQIRVPLRS